MKLLSVFIVCTIVTINCIRGHEDQPNRTGNDVDDMEIENILRRKNDFFAREWQYEGLPIDAEPFRRAMVEKARTKTRTQTTPNPNTKPMIYRRIFNAETAVTIEDHPYMAALLVNDQLWCGAAIIAEDAVITAAHCLQLQYNNRFFREYYKMLSVRVGSSNATGGGHVYQVREIFFHPNYKPQNLDFNFAILKMNKNMTEGEEDNLVKVIPLAKRVALTADQKIDFLGWGSDVDKGRGGRVPLQKVSLPIYETADCREVYGRELVTSTNFCAGYISLAKNVCNHDAGGPAVLDRELVGILSFSNRKCDEPDRPAVFSGVAAVEDWIQAILTKGKQPTFKSPKLTRRRNMPSRLSN